MSAPLNPSPEMGKVKLDEQITNVTMMIEAGTNNGKCPWPVMEAVLATLNSHAALIAERDELVRALRTILNAESFKEIFDTAEAALKATSVADTSCAGKEGGV